MFSIYSIVYSMISKIFSKVESCSVAAVSVEVYGYSRCKAHDKDIIVLVVQFSGLTTVTSRHGADGW